MGNGKEKRGTPTRAGRGRAAPRARAVAGRAWYVGGGALLLILLGAGAARADEVVSKGTVLRGKITALSGAVVAFEPEYGTGVLAIKWADIDNLRSDGPFQVLYGEDRECNAPLSGFSDGTLTAGSDGIDVKTIHSGQPIGDGGPSFRDRMRSAWRFWDGSFDLGVNVQQATTDSTGFVLGLRTRRSNGPTRLMLGAAYRYGEQEEKDGDSQRTLDQALGAVRGEYDFAPRFYGFLSGDATYDGIQRLSVRGVPKAGLGYVLWEDKPAEGVRNFLQADVGGAWVYERYFGGDTDQFYAAAFGASAGYLLPYGARLDWRVDYLPALSDFTGDYLLRSEAGVAVPLLDAIAARVSLLDEYDSTPASGADSNSLFLTVGLSVLW